MSLTDQQFVRLLMQETANLSNSSLAQIVYLLQRSGDPSHFRFRFDYTPFLGMHSAELEGLIEAERLHTMLGRNGLPTDAGTDVRHRLREFLGQLPGAEGDLRLVAVADFLRWNEWDRRGNGDLCEMVERVQSRLAPRSAMAAEAVLDCLDRLRLPTRQAKVGTSS